MRAPKATETVGVDPWEKREEVCFSREYGQPERWEGATLQPKAYAGSRNLLRAEETELGKVAADGWEAG